MKYKSSRYHLDSDQAQAWEEIKQQEQLRQDAHRYLHGGHTLDLFGQRDMPELAALSMKR